MSACLEQLLRDSGDAVRLADIARNDVLMGIAAPAVELDEAFVRSDLAYQQAKDDGSLTRSRDERALAEQMQRGRTGV
jgi:hypothetical protein